MYELLYSERAKKFLKKLDKDSQKRIISSIERCRIRPYHFVSKIVASKYFRLRAGDYRVILKIEDGELTILIIKIGHRRNVYKG